MAQRSWKESLSAFFKKDGSRDAKTPQSNLELVRKCLKHTQRMTKPNVSTVSQLNRGQCEHLVQKLQVAIQSAEACVLPFHSPEVLVECVQSVELLCRSAKEIETFILTCSKDNWIEAAVESANMSEHVSSLSFDLEFCTVLYRSIHKSLIVLQDELAELELLSRSKEMVKDRVLHDQYTLLSRLESLDHSSHDSESGQESQLSQLAKSLSRKLKQTLSGTVDLSVWEIDSQNVTQMQRLGNGAAGEVHKSIWSGTEVAEKIFHGSDHPGFKNEVKILAGLAHPNIVPLLGYTIDGDDCSILMELMENDLSHLMKKKLRENRTCKIPFTTFEGVDKMLQTAEGMLYLHENKVVHRDLKSQNILVTTKKDIDAEYIYVKVADFGLSKTKESSSSYSNLTLNTGTTRWMAPELMISRDENLHARTSDHDEELKYPFKVDIYSFGMVCFEILTGQVPFAKVSLLGEVKKKVLDGERPELPDHCPDDLKILISSCWDQEPSRRPSFVEICKRLRILKYLLMRGFNPAFLARHRPIEANARRLAWKVIARRLALEGKSVLFNKTEPINQSLNVFCTSINGVRVAVRIYPTKLVHHSANMQNIHEKVLQIEQLDHKNVLKTLCCCWNDKLKVFVNEYSALGSLDTMLYGKSDNEIFNSSIPILTWAQRVKIAIGVARGLDFLHTQIPPIICDSIQSSNILMFDDDVAKIGNITPLNTNNNYFKKIDITQFLLIPEMRESNKFGTEETNFYDFGVLLVELLSGKPIKALYELTTRMLSKENVHKIVDPRLSSNYPTEAIVKMACLANICLQYTLDDPLGLANMCLQYDKFDGPFGSFLIEALQSLCSIET